MLDFDIYPRDNTKITIIITKQKPINYNNY